MAAAEELTWEISLANGGARRPDIDDLGSAELVDDDEAPPPKDGTQLYADMPNQWAMQIAAMARTQSPLKITIEFVAGAPQIESFSACNSLLEADDFTLTDIGPGETRIEWPAGSLPPLNTDPVLTIGALPASSANTSQGLVTDYPNNRVTVLTLEDGTGIDLRFTLHF